MSQPGYAATHSQRPTNDEINRIKKLELKDQIGPPLKLASSYIGSPHCPDCGYILKTKHVKSHTTQWILQCSNFHAWLVAVDGETTFTKITDSDPRYPRRNIKA